MSCWHGPHGCGPYPPEANWRGWSDPGDWFDDADWQMPRRGRRPRQPDAEVHAADLEARLEELGQMIRRIETELAVLRKSSECDLGT